MNKRNATGRNLLSLLSLGPSLADFTDHLEVIHVVGVEDRGNTNTPGAAEKFGDLQ